MTLTEAINILSTKIQGNSFADSLVRQFRNRRSLSPRQEFWAKKLAEEAENPAPKVGDGERFNFDAIMSLFQKAAEKLKYPKVRLFVDGTVILLSRAGERSRYRGSINVTTDGPFHGRTWFGRIGSDGTLTSGRGMTEAVLGVLRAFEADPAGVAAEHGKNMGNCCFCNKLLGAGEDKRSVEVGYGPVCASNFNLPWGE